MGHRQQIVFKGAGTAPGDGPGGNGSTDDEQLADVQIRPARQEDFELLYGKPPPFTCQALTVVYRGEAVAMAGVTLTPGGYVMCMVMKDGIGAPKIKVWRCAKRMMSLIVQNKNVVYAGADAKYPNSAKFLVKLGFEYFCNDEQGGEIYIWRTRQP